MLPVCLLFLFFKKTNPYPIANSQATLKPPISCLFYNTLPHNVPSSHVDELIETQNAVTPHHAINALGQTRERIR